MNANRPTDEAKEAIPSFDELFPLPPGVKLRTPRFGTAGPSGLKPASGTGDAAEDDRGRPSELFFIDWRDDSLGLHVRVQEQGNGELIAYVTCTDGRRIGQAVSVALVGTIEDHMIRKTIPLKAGAVAQHPDILPALAELLRHGDDHQIREAAEAVGKIGAAVAQHPDILPALVELLRRGDAVQREAAAETVGKIGAAAAQHPDIVRALDDLLRHGDDVQKRAATKAAQGIEQEKAACRGAANFGTLANATQELGEQLGIVAFILE